MCHKRKGSGRFPGAVRGVHAVGAVLQRGFALVTAIFLLVVLAALGAFMVSMSGVQHTTSAQDVQGSRAYQAARAGIEWGVYQIMAPENANYGLTTGFTTQYSCPAAVAVIGTLNTMNGTLAGFSVPVSCASTSYTEAGNLVTVYQVTADASFGTANSVDFVRRKLTATVSTCRQTANGANCE